MKRAALLLGLLWALPASGVTLTFEEALARAYDKYELADAPADAIRELENPSRLQWPSMRAEGTLSNARDVDLFNENVVHNQVFSAVMTVDYPLVDGGVTDLRKRAGLLHATSYKHRRRELADELFEETLDAVARLYTAQERKKILQAGFQRAVDMKERADKLLGVREISTVTATQWQDEALAAESELIELDLQRLEAETRLKQLIGDRSSEPLEIVIPLDDAGSITSLAPRIESDLAYPRASLLAQQRQLSLEEARAARRPSVMLSAFGGVAAVPSSSSNFYSGNNESYMLYGLRVSVALPMFDAAARRREAEARLAAAEAELERTTTLNRLRRQSALRALNVFGITQRIQLLSQAVAVAKQRAESVARLTAAGLRSEAMLAGAQADVSRRESDLLAARVELWRHAQLMKRRSGDASVEVAGGR